MVVNGSVVGLLREWTAFQLNNVEAVDSRIRVGAILVNPVGGYTLPPLPGARACARAGLPARCHHCAVPMHAHVQACPPPPLALHNAVVCDLCVLTGEDVVFPAYNCEEIVLTAA